MGKFIWEPDAAPGGRYRDKSTGRFVKPEVVRGELDTILENSNKDTTQVLAEQLRNRELSVQDWQLEMRAHIKEVHINSIALERGGFQNMTPADYGRAGQIIREQYGYLDKFAKEIQTGEQKLDGTLQARAKLYTEAGRETFYKSKQANITQGDEAATHVASHLNPADHCFLGGTLINTPNGDKYIEDILVGDLVNTLSGVKCVTRLYRREYTGPILKISAGDNAVYCTPNHPFLGRGGWIEAQKLRNGNDAFLYQDGFHSIKTHVAFPNAINSITALAKIRLFGLISFLLFYLPFVQRIKSRVSVPPISICFNDYSVIDYGIDNKFGLDHLIFLIRNIKFFKIVKKIQFELSRIVKLQFPISFKKFFGNIWSVYPKLYCSFSKYFRRSWNLRRIIVSHVFRSLGMNKIMHGSLGEFYTKFVCPVYNSSSRSMRKLFFYPICSKGRVIFRNYSIFFFRPAFEKWSAIKTILSFSIASIFALRTSLQFILSGFRTAIEAQIPLSIANVSAHWTNFFCLSFAPKFMVTGMGAKLILPFSKSSVAVKAFSILHHNNPQQELYHKQHTVYNLEVEDVHHYVANGFVVHNCDECVALDGKIFRIGDKAYKLPGQRICRKNCKCSEVYYRFVDGEYVEVGNG